MNRFGYAVAERTPLNMTTVTGILIIILGVVMIQLKPRVTN
jgi:uncharacterized membrane protein YdcZ (DUF606 family)